MNDAEQKLCVLIDFENVAAGAEKEGHGRFDIRAVMRRLKDKGRILVARAYGDWGRYAKFKQDLLKQGVTMVELTSYRGQEKNRADIALVVDAMELAFTRDYLDTFVLMSGDSDFTPLVSRLKELNRRVIGIGTRGSTSRLIIEGCDEFIFYESLKKHEQALKRDEQAERATQRRAAQPEPAAADEEDAAPLSEEEAMALLVETVAGIQKDQPGPVLAGMVKQSLQRKEPAFDEGDWGYAGFTRFLQAAQRRGLVHLVEDTRAGGYRVDLPTDGEVPPPAETAEAPVEDPFADLALPGEAGRMQKALAEAGIHPLTRMTRHTVVHEFVDHVIERQSQRKRNTLTYVYGDIARRCRKNDPAIPADLVRPVIDALKLAGELKHTDGNPVRSRTANFTIDKDAEELLESLDHLYLETLADLGFGLDDARSLSLLLWGDEGHQREAGELAAWVLHERAAERPAAPAEDRATGAGDGSAGQRASTEAKDAAPAEAEDAAPAEAATAEE